MNRFFFFDLRARPKYMALTGHENDILTLINEIFAGEVNLDNSLYLNQSDVSSQIIGTTRNKDWERIIRTMLILVSGKKISDKHLSIYKNMYTMIEKRYKNKINLDLKFASFFVTLMTVFRLHTFGWSEQGSNKIDDFLNFVDNIILNRNLKTFVSSIFCAHRESDDIEPNTLVAKIKEVSLRRYVYILQSIFLNIDSKDVKINLYHTDGGLNALNEIFPNIALKYIRENRVEELLSQMDSHFDNAKKVIKEMHIPGIDIEVLPVDLFVQNVRFECQKVCGTNWRKIDNFNTIKDSDIRTITQEMTFKDISRYMPEFKKTINIGSFSTDSKKVNKVVNWYLGDGQLNLHSKSLYETMFYYYWGKLTKVENGIAIGIDRDHDLFQVESFSLGYNNILDISFSSPLLYARRSEDELNDDDINSTSIRQFWRLSENIKK